MRDDDEGDDSSVLGGLSVGGEAESKGSEQGARRHSNSVTLGLGVPPVVLEEGDDDDDDDNASTRSVGGAGANWKVGKKPLMGVWAVDLMPIAVLT
jgi:hypothetical protein